MPGDSMRLPACECMRRLLGTAAEAKRQMIRENDENECKLMEGEAVTRKLLQTNIEKRKRARIMVQPLTRRCDDSLRCLLVFHRLTESHSFIKSECEVMHTCPRRS